VLLVYGVGLAPFDTLVWSEQKAAMNGLGLQMHLSCSPVSFVCLNNGVVSRCSTSDCCQQGLAL
jgi:hypothetical protein